jgi:hypothetical protein
MTITTPATASTPTTPSPARTAHQNNRDIQALIASAAAGLVPMFDAQKQLFCARLIQSELGQSESGQSQSAISARGMVQDGISHRYTLITLMGLHRMEHAGTASPIGIMLAFDGLLRETAWVKSAGDLGLLLWLCALVAPERIAEFLSRHDLEPALEKFADGRERRTMELSWIFSGLAHAVHARPELRERLTPLASRLYALLKENRGPAGAFGHQAPTAGLGGGVKGLLRGRLGSFADQVYPIYAFAWASRAFQFGEALNISNACADNICKEQGPLGQWWWHYDAKSGAAVGKYPVYSVHQHAMAPLALFALMDAGGRDSTREIYLGLEWIYGANELHLDMRDAASQTVWRCIRPTKTRRYLDEAKAMLKLGSRAPVPRTLHVLHECWPYELGWLIYAFAARAIEGD